MQNVKIEGRRHTLTYSDGTTLEVEVEESHYVLTKEGIRYDGFSPINSRGFMAVWKEGEVVVPCPPGKKLVIVPSRKRHEFLVDKQPSCV